jgi:putative redox protein
MPRTVYVDAGRLRYAQNISVGPHALQADELTDSGGNDVGPNPYELLLAALGACVSITVRMYAERKLWSLNEVHVVLSYTKLHAEDCVECDTKSAMMDQIEMGVSLIGDLSEDQQRRLIEIANICPVHRTLTSRVQIHTTPLVANSPPQRI